MKKIKRKLSKFLSIVLVATLMMNSEVKTLATISQEELTIETPEEESTEEELESTEPSTEIPEEESTEKELESTEPSTEIPEEESTKEELESTEPSTDLEEEEITPFSLLPLEEVYAYLILNEYSEEEIKEMPLETVLSLLTDSEGESIEIPKDAEVVWSYFKDENGKILNDEYHVIGHGDKVDLSQYTTTTNYTMELIIGSGKQLDANNIRYIVKVYISDMLPEDIDYYLYKDNKSYRQQVWSSNIITRGSYILDDINIPVISVSYITSSYKEGNSYYLGIKSDIASDPLRKDIQVDVYPMKEFLKYYQNGEPLSGAITDQILNQEDLYHEGGYLGTYTALDSSEDFLDADNIFCIVYTDAESGRLIAYYGLIFSVCSDKLNVTGKILSYENNQMKDITSKESSYDYSFYWKIHLMSEGNGMEIGNVITQGKDYKLIEGYSSNAEYYYVLDNNEHVKKVVQGRFKTLKEAEDAGAEDITDYLLPSDRSKLPYGYRIKYGNTIYFTVFFDNGTVLSYDIDIYSTTKPSTSINYDNAPNVRTTDPYFRVQGVEGYSKYNDIYIIENDYRTTLDTLYSYGYQTLFINDETVDLSKLKPTFWCPDSVRVHVGEEQISGVSEQDFSKGSVYYAVHVGDNLKNYQVTFAKKEKGPKLFVNGPSEREIFLDEYFEGKHDILIANIGDEKLTGLNVELLDAVNVKLDDYWVVGGEKNDTLAAFDSVNFHSSYSELANLAKIRLLPDGEGDVTGTLKISADGQKDVYIKLTGHAGNPKIITESLSDAVKYVPYSYVVATNNMHDWNKVTFSISSGTLPEGLKLYPNTGEIYGVPLETGEFPITVKATYSRREYTPSYVELTLIVNDNTNQNVYNSSDEGYEIKQYIGTEDIMGTYDYLLNNINDQTFISTGEYHEFIDFWLNGEKLTEGEDYIKNSGSTRITIRSQTFRDKAKEGSNTIAAEFRVGGDKSKELKRTAQNFRLDIQQSDNNDNNNNDSENETDQDKDNTDNGSDNNNSSSDNNTSNNQNESNKNNNSDNENEIEDDTLNIYSEDLWVKDRVGWRYKKPNGAWLLHTWCKLPYKGTNEWYYFDERGYIVTGWLKEGENWYYLNPLSDGTQGKMYIGWKLIDGNWCYFKEDGVLVTNTWYQLLYKETNEWYYFNEKGYMVTGWLKEGENWYYLNPQSDGTQGKMYTGWQLIDEKWYYFNEVSDGKKGTLMADTWIGDYYVDENGVWIEKQKQ